MARKILVVDGDPDVRDLIVSGLAGEGYQVFSAGSGEEGVEIARTERPDLICLELALPGMDGLETVRCLRQDPRTEHIPFVFLTGRTNLKDRVEGLRAGAHAYLAKPFAFPELFATVAGILQRTSATDGVPSSVSASLGLIGSLGAMSLTSLIQALEAERQTGVLRIVSGIRWGKIVFHEGKILSAIAGNLAGEEAVCELVGWNSGTYAFRAEPVEPGPPLAESATSVLMRALRVYDERKATAPP